MLKSLYITNLGLLDNLAETQILPYLEGVPKDRVKFTILSYEKKENLRDNRRIGELKERLAANNIEWYYLLYHNRWGNLFDVIAGWIKVARIIRTGQIHVLHGRSSIPILIAWPISKLCGLKVVYDRRGTMFGDFVDDVNIKNIFSIKIFSGMLESIDRFIMRRSDAVIVLSERSHDILKDDALRGRDKVFLQSIPCCTGIDKFDVERNALALPTDLDGRFVVTYLGSLGTCYLLKEMAEFFKIMKQNKNAFFLIISHSDRGYIEETFKNEGLKPKEDYCIVDVKPDEVPHYLIWSDVSIMFIKPVECKIGSSPTKFGESLAAGIPVVVNKGIGDTEDIINREGIGVITNSFDVEGYRHACDKLYTLIEENEVLRKRCRETAKKHFSLKTGIEKYTEIYKKIEEVGL